MRTTLIIDDHVLKEAKRRAVEGGITLGELTTRALREILRQSGERRAGYEFRMLTFGEGTSAETSPADLAALRDDGS